MLQTFKVSLLNGDRVINNIYVFAGARTGRIQGATDGLSALFASDPRHEVFSSIFTDAELDAISANGIDVRFVEDSLYLDDTLGAVKLKILQALGGEASVEEMYLFTTARRSLNPVKAYETMTQNGRLELTRDRMIQFLSNLDLDISSLEPRDVYDYNDVLGLDIQKQPVTVKEPVGQEFFAVEGRYLYTVNPFDALVYDEFLEKYADDTITTLNADLLLDSLPLESNMLYLCLAEDVYKYASGMGLSSTTTTKVYYPFLLRKGITDAASLAEQKLSLVEASRELLSSKAASQFKNVALFHDVYRERTTELSYLEYGIEYVSFVIKPPYKFNLPLDTIFKIIHATQSVPLIKYNPGPRQEKIYKLYTDKIARNGKKIPYLSKGSIFRLMRTMGRTKTVAVYTEHSYQGSVVQITCDFGSDGSVQTVVESKQPLPRGACEGIIRDAVNPVLETVRDFLEQSGYEMSSFSDFASPSVEIFRLRHVSQLSITKNIRLAKFMGCLSSVFNVLESDLKTGILMRYKRVANYNEMDNITAFMTEQLKIGMGDAELVESLVQNFAIKVDDAKRRLAALLGEFQVEQGLYANKRLRVRNNPGFPVRIMQDKFKNDIFMEIDNVDNIHYLETIPIYLDSLIRITQDIASTMVPASQILQVCSSGSGEDVAVLEDIVASAEADGMQQVEELQFGDDPDAGSEDADDLLDFMAGDTDDAGESGGVEDAADAILEAGEDLLSKTLRFQSTGGQASSTSGSSLESAADDDLLDLLDFMPGPAEEPLADSPSAPAEGSLGEAVAGPLAPPSDSSEGDIASLEAPVQDVVESVAEAAAETAQSAVKDATETAQSVAETAQSVAEDAAEAVQGVAEDAAEEVRGAAETVQSVAEDAAETVQGAAEDAAEEVQSVAEDAAETVQSVAEDAAETVQGVAVPVEESSVDLAAPVQELAVPAEESPVEESPVEESPVEESPVEESPVEESPVEESPVEESPAGIVGRDIGELVADLSRQQGDAAKSSPDKGSAPEDDGEVLVNDITGMNLSNPNPVFTRLREAEPTLFLTQDVGNYKQYSRTCPWNVRRQPILLTQKEKDRIDRDHPGSYEHAIKYGSNPENPYYYICPRYWCLLNNTSLTEEDVRQGKCGGQIIPRGAKKVPRGKYILEFNHPSEHQDEDGNYIPHHPGFLKNPNPDGKCIPCCFKNWDAPEQQQRRQECASDSGKRKRKQPSQTEIDHYIKDADKVPLNPARWGYLPISVQKFLHTDNLKCQVGHNNHNIKPFHTCILRHGVEISETQSFVACVADLFVDIIGAAKVPTIAEMKQYMIEASSLASFLTYQNGSLVAEFRGDDEEVEAVDVGPYKDTAIARSLDLSNPDNLFYLQGVVSAYLNFTAFLQDDSVVIDYTYLWDMVCAPNPALFPKGINLVIMQQTNHDVTDNLEITCPSSHYARSFYEVGRSTFMVLKTGNYYEPIYAYRNDETRLRVTKTFNEFSNQLLPNIRSVLGVVKRIFQQNCRPLPSMPRAYKFRTNIVLASLVAGLAKAGYRAYSQVLNYQGKAIGVTAGGESGPRGFIPCFPSAIDPGMPILYMDDPEIWRPYDTTVSFLGEVSSRSKGEVLSKPVIKVLDDGLVVGVITETNQFVEVDPPNENVADDGLHVVDGSSFLVADQVAESSTGTDVERRNIVKRIELESNFYSVFRNSMRALLNDPKNRTLRGRVEETIDTEYLIYSEKLKTVDAELRELGRSHITFTNYSTEVLDRVSGVTGCLSNDPGRCQDKPYCMVSAGAGCNLLVPKRHLITDLDNEKIYYARLADEMIRYSRVRQFIFEPKEFLNFDAVDYNLWPTEIILLQSLLSQDYFENLVPMARNPYVSRNTYATADPIISQAYTSKQSLDDIHRPKPLTVCEPTRKREISGKWESKLPSKAFEYIFAPTPACTFSLMIMIIKNKTGMELEPFILRRVLLQAYDKYLADYKDQVFSVLTAEGKKSMMHQVFYKQLSFENLVMSESYYLTVLDMWLLAEHYRLPVIFLSGTELVETGDSILLTMESPDDSYYIIKAPGVQADTATKFRLISLVDGVYIPLTSLPPSMRVLVSSIVTRQSSDHKPIVPLPDFIKGFDVIKRRRKPRKKLENFVVVPAKGPEDAVPSLPTLATAVDVTRSKKLGRRTLQATPTPDVPVEVVDLAELAGTPTASPPGATARRRRPALATRQAIANIPVPSFSPPSLPPGARSSTTDPGDEDQGELIGPIKLTLD